MCLGALRGEHSLKVARWARAGQTFPLGDHPPGGGGGPSSLGWGTTRGGEGTTVVGTAEDGLLHLEYYQDGLRVVNRQCKMESISFAIPSSDSPLDCPPSPLPNTQSSSPPKALGPSPCHKNQEGPPQGLLILRVFPRGVPRGSSGGT